MIYQPELAEEDPMSIGSKRNFFVIAIMLGSLILASAPAEAQRDFEPLFDKFNFKIAGSWVGLTTEIRLESDLTEGNGTTLNFEDDLDLGSNKTIPTLAFEWQIARKHKLGVRWQDIDRDSSAQALTEIEWGDETIPIDAAVTLGFDITQTYIDYTYYPWVKERWAAGFGLGLRVMDFQVTLEWRDENEDMEGSSDVKATGPLPYIYFEYRRLFSDNWRFITGLGWLYVSIDDISGGQLIGRAGIEYLAGKRWSFGGALNLSTINVDWDGLKDEGDNAVLKGAIEMAINDITVFMRVRF
jgi:hypothetical protein